MKTQDKAAWIILAVGTLAIGGTSIIMMNNSKKSRSDVTALNEPERSPDLDSPIEPTKEHRANLNNEAVSSEPRREIVEVRLPAKVKIKRITVTRDKSLKGRIVALGDGKFELSGDKGQSFSSNGHYLFSGTFEEEEGAGGKLALEINLQSGESKEDVRSGIAQLLGRCSSIEYFENATLIHGAISPINLEMVMDDEPKEIEGITCLSFSENEDLDENVFKNIKYFQYLKRLFLSHTSVSDSDLSHLGELHHLRVLYLSETQITDSGLTHLKKMTQLHTLGLSGTKVSDEGLEELRRSMPDTRGIAR